MILSFPMPTHAFTRRLLCWGTALAIIALTTARGAGEVTLVVEPGRTFQTFEGWGVSLCWSGKVIGAFPEPTRSEYADLMFHPTKGLGFTIARYNIGGGENPALKPLGFREGIEGYQPTKGQWNWNADPGQRWLLRGLQEPALPGGTVQAGRFAATLPGRSVTTFVFSGLSR